MSSLSAGASRKRWVLVSLVAMAACVESDRLATVDGSPRQLVFPAREIPLEAGLVDSCELLAEAEPFDYLGPSTASRAIRIDRVCILPGADGLLSRSLQVELRRPDSMEVELGQFPTNEEEFWLAEGGGVGLLGGVREEIRELEGVGDYAVWYPIRDGMALRAYWNDDTILAVHARGIPVEQGLDWAQGVAASAIAKTAALSEPRG